MSFQVELMKPFGAIVRAAEKNLRPFDLDPNLLRQLFRKHQLVLLRGFAEFADNDDFTHYCASFGEISVWPFGKVLELVEHENPEDHIFDHSYVPLHWDGMYRPQVPEYQIFRCVKAPLYSEGGQTTFSNTKTVLENASLEDKTLWQKTTGTYQRKMEYYCSQTVSPIVTEHPYLGFPVLRYNEPPEIEKGPFINPADLHFTGPEFEELPMLHQSLKKALYDPQHFYAHQWQTGDLVITDNFSLLHGRERFISGCSRHLQRVHVLSDPPFENPALRSHR